MRIERKTTRRVVVNGLLAGALTTGLADLAVADRPRADPGPAAPSRSLKELARAKGILFGSSVGAGRPGTLAGSFNDPRYLDILQKECAVIVPENELKSYVIAGERDRYDFDPGDRIASFARSRHIELRGHNLLWNRTEYTPRWLLDWFGTLSAAAAERYLRDYIHQVCTHYGDQIRSWDVVNETVDPKTGELRDTPFTRVLGFDVLRVAFEAAQESAPHAQRVYNDYMSWSAHDETHRGGVLRLLQQLRSHKVPVDALGIQSHLGTDDNGTAVQPRQWKAFVDEVVGMGYSLLITELDINDKALPTDIGQRDAQVAAVARGYLDMMLSHRELTAVLCWGMVDKYSWLQSFSKRADDEPQRPDPYDSHYRPKLLREALAAAFAAAPRRG